jgi:hypothetical protein
LALRASALLLASALSAFACSKNEAEQKKDPWLAAPTSSAARAAKLSRYRVDTRCEMRISLPAKDATPRGTARVCRGELEVDLFDLEKTTGTIQVDLGSIEMDAEGDGGASTDFTRTAQNWLDLGSSRPEAERERQRWATFTLGNVEDLSAERASEGKRTKTTGDLAVDVDGGPRTETRSVTLTAKGTLQLHGVRVDAELPIKADFHFPEAAAPDVRPDRIELTSRRPLVVSLAQHEIKPRNAQGVFVAAETKLIGTTIGKDAKVTLSVSLKP